MSADPATTDEYLAGLPDDQREALEALAEDLEGYDTSRKVVRFAPSEPLPAALVKEIVGIRPGEIEAVTTPGN